MSKSLILRPNVKTVVFFFSFSVIVVILTACHFLTWGLFGEWFGYFLFGSSTILWMLCLLPNSNYLELTEEGFVIQVIFWKRKRKWSEVKDFAVLQKTPHKIPIVGYNLRVAFSHLEQPGVLDLLSERQCTLPNIYGISALQLCDVMNAWQQKYSRNEID